MMDLLEKILQIDEQYRGMEWGFIDLSGKRVTDIGDHERYAREYLEDHHLSTPKLDTESIAKFQQLTGYIRYTIGREVGFTILNPATPAQMHTIRKMSRNTDVWFDISDKKGYILLSGKGVLNLTSALKNMDLLEKILQVDESSTDFNQQLRQIGTIEDIEKLVEEAEKYDYSLYSKRDSSWVFDFHPVTNPKKVKYLLDSGKVGVCLISNLYKLAKFVLEKGVSKVKESSIDFPQEDLDLTIWDKEDGVYTLKEEVKEKIFNFIKEYPDKDLLGIAEEIHIVGSIASNLYLDDADIDVHIVPKSTEEWDEESIKVLRKWFDSHRDELEGYVDGHPFEIYIQTEPLQDKMSVGCYSITNDEWITGPTIKSQDYDPYKDFSYILGDVKDIVKDADVLFGELKRDLTDYDVIKTAMERMSQEDREKLLQKLQDKLVEIEDSIELLYKERKGFIDIRSTIDAEQALKDVEYMKKWNDDNATFKYINRYKYLKTIGDLKDLLADEKITPDEVDKIKSIMGV